MDQRIAYLPYHATGHFSRIVTDYVAADEKLKPFYSFPVSIDGIRSAITERKKYNNNRKLLVGKLKQQYKDTPINEKLKANIEQLLDENTFTITTAHQPNIFTGHLYFMYKILHAIKLADHVQNELKGYKFVPVFYMGSEDADLDELGQIHLFGEKYVWNTAQQGAVGRMKVDKELLKLLALLNGQLSVLPYGVELMQLLQDAYKEGTTIEAATFKLIHGLFGEFGLVVVLPDDAELKSVFVPVMKKELQESFSSKAVSSTVAAFPKEYKVQAAGREVNLFYLKDNVRERISSEFGVWSLELEKHPDRISPNVILRPVFQEMVLPNVAFIGGGGELAYWLELKKVFEEVNVPFPVLVLRNSFMLIDKDQQTLLGKLKFSPTDIFRSESELMNELVKRESKVSLKLDKEAAQVEKTYESAKSAATKIDESLLKHVEALKTRSLKGIAQLEKKMLKAEKKKFEAQQRQLKKLKAQLFPDDGLQERVENFMPYYSKYGPEIIKIIYEFSLALEQQFSIISL